jgi:hypothetical protein
MPISDESLTLAIEELSRSSERVGYLIAHGDPNRAAEVAKRRRDASAALLDLIREQVSGAFERGVEAGRTSKG